MKHKLLILVAALGLTGCAGWKPIVQSIDDVARYLCAEHFSGKQGVSLEDAWRTYCKAREDFAPWIDPVIAAQQEGVAIAEGAKPEPEPAE